MKTMDQFTPAELHEWINGTYRAQTEQAIAVLTNASPSELARDFDVSRYTAVQLRSAVAALGSPATA